MRSDLPPGVTNISLAEQRIAGDLWGCVQEGRKRCIDGLDMPRGVTVYDRFREVGWRLEKVQLESLHALEDRALVIIDTGLLRSLYMRARRKFREIIAARNEHGNR